ncbi:MAG: SDR family NAD(P)-dependent oxidoreductase [Acidimicrobiales bacterium]
MDLEGSTVLVTGAAGGLGQAVVRRLKAVGARPILTDLESEERLAALGREIGAPTFCADLSRRDEVVAMMDEIRSAVGVLDGVVANAAFMSMGSLAQQPVEDWWRHFDVNLTGTFHVCQMAAKAMLSQGAGRLILVASEWGIGGRRNATAYAGSKGGLVALVKTLGRELGPAGIHVNGLAPGVIDTPQLSADAAAEGVTILEIRRRYGEQIPLGRVADPEEIAEAVLFLLSERSDALLGQVLQPNGGSTRARA